MSAATAAARSVMPLAGHAREARSRSMRAAVALVVGIIAGYGLSDGILEILRDPIAQIALARNASLNYDSVSAAFVSPGLTHRERRMTAGYTVAAVVLFAAGCTLGFTIFPHVVEVLTSFSFDQDSSILDAGTYVDFVLKLVAATGVAFVLPVLVVLLNAVGLVSSQTIRRHWRVVVVSIVLFSALVTPAADVLSMFLVAAPMSALFAAALVITDLADRRRARRDTLDRR